MEVAERFYNGILKVQIFIVLFYDCFTVIGFVAVIYLFKSGSHINLFNQQIKYDWKYNKRLVELLT